MNSIPLPPFETSDFSAVQSPILPSAPASRPTSEMIADRIPSDATVMIVDDEAFNVDLVQVYLENEGFVNFVTTNDATSALSLMATTKPDIVLLDIQMPQISGLQILQNMREAQHLSVIPVLILTASTDPETKLNALRLGATDFLAKPVDPSELALRIQNVLSAKAYRDHLERYSDRLEEQVRVRTHELLQSRTEAIHCLARAGEYRDDDTGHHVMRVGQYSAVIAEELGFPEAAVELIQQAAQLHDVGKIGIPDAILHKPGRLDGDEFDFIKRHCAIGQQIIDPLTLSEEEQLASHTTVGMQIMQSTSSPILKMAAVIASTHHEKWDGTGYPNQLSGNDIPIEGRIVAVADVFDALSSERPYKKAFPVEKCLSILQEGRGTHFDPRPLDAFFNRLDDVIRIKSRFM